MNLNSTLILLILIPKVNRNEFSTQFKFHFDSINIISGAVIETAEANLNSTLILLIFPAFFARLIMFSHLNSTLILLIWLWSSIKNTFTNLFKFHFDSININNWYSNCRAVPVFKFHFDSINMKTLLEVLVKAEDLNSTLILLICFSDLEDVLNDMI